MARGLFISSLILEKFVYYIYNIQAHWKRKIDLSYIESTSLTQVSRNIADNLSFCIDGTNEDLRAYSREVKDYLSSELGQETEIEMLVKCCFNDLYPSFTSNTHPNLDSAVRARANNYFLNNSHSNDGRLACRQCKIKFVKPSDLLQHNRYVHKMSINTTFDFFQHTSMDIDDTEPMANTPINISPIGYSITSLLFLTSSTCLFYTDISAVIPLPIC